MPTNGIKINSTGVFEKMSDAELLKAYNDVCGTSETSLSAEREIVIDRLLRVLAVKRPGKPEKPRKPKPEKKVKRMGPGRPHEPFDLKPHPGPRICSRQSIRWRVLEACKKGATLQDLIKATGIISHKRNYNYVRQLHDEMGWGVREIDGVITVYE